jgi:hypothetical protein
MARRDLAQIYGLTTLSPRWGFATFLLRTQGLRPGLNPCAALRLSPGGEGVHNLSRTGRP